MVSKNLIEKYMTEILNSKSLRELADNLDQFLDQLKIQSNKLFYISKLYDNIRNVFNPMEKSNKPYIILKNENAVLLYLYLSWNDDSFHSGAVNTLNEIIQFLRETIVSPQEPRLSCNEIYTVLNHLETRFEFNRHLLNDTLFIALLNDTHATCNSFYLFNNSGNNIRDAIFITHPLHHFGCPQQHTLLHEIGHLLHVRLTNNKNYLPKSFREVQEIMFADSFRHSAETVSDIFADCFSLAATICTDIEQSNPLNPMQPSDKRILDGYFTLLINTFMENPLGELTVHQMQEVLGGTT